MSEETAALCASFVAFKPLANEVLKCCTTSAQTPSQAFENFKAHASQYGSCLYAYDCELIPVPRGSPQDHSCLGRDTIISSMKFSQQTAEKQCHVRYPMLLQHVDVIAQCIADYCGVLRNDTECGETDLDEFCRFLQLLDADTASTLSSSTQAFGSKALLMLTVASQLITAMTWSAVSARTVLRILCHSSAAREDAPLLHSIVGFAITTSESLQVYAEEWRKVFPSSEKAADGLAVWLGYITSLIGPHLISQQITCMKSKTSHTIEEIGFGIVEADIDTYSAKYGLPALPTWCGVRLLEVASKFTHRICDSILFYTSQRHESAAEYDEYAVKMMERLGAIYIQHGSADARYLLCLKWAQLVADSDNKSAALHWKLAPSLNLDATQVRCLSAVLDGCAEMARKARMAICYALRSTQMAAGHTHITDLFPISKQSEPHLCTFSRHLLCDAPALTAFAVPESRDATRECIAVVSFASQQQVLACKPQALAFIHEVLESKGVCVDTGSIGGLKITVMASRLKAATTAAEESTLPAWLKSTDALCFLSGIPHFTPLTDASAVLDTIYDALNALALLVTTDHVTLHFITGDTLVAVDDAAAVSTYMMDLLDRTDLGDGQEVLAMASALAVIHVAAAAFPQASGLSAIHAGWCLDYLCNWMKFSAGGRCATFRSICSDVALKCASRASSLPASVPPSPPCSSLSRLLCSAPWLCEKSVTKQYVDTAAVEAVVWVLQECAWVAEELVAGSFASLATRRQRRRVGCVLSDSDDEPATTVHRSSLSNVEMAIAQRFCQSSCLDVIVHACCMILQQVPMEVLAPCGQALAIAVTLLHPTVKNGWTLYVMQQALNRLHSELLIADENDALRASLVQCFAVARLPDAHGWSVWAPSALQMKRLTEADYWRRSSASGMLHIMPSSLSAGRRADVLYDAFAATIHEIFPSMKVADARGQELAPPRRCPPSPPEHSYQQLWLLLRTATCSLNETGPAGCTQVDDAACLCHSPLKSVSAAGMSECRLVVIIGQAVVSLCCYWNMTSPAITQEIQSFVEALEHHVSTCAPDTPCLNSHAGTALFFEELGQHCEQSFAGVLPTRALESSQSIVTTVASKLASSSPAPKPSPRKRSPGLPSLLKSGALDHCDGVMLTRACKLKQATRNPFLWWRCVVDVVAETTIANDNTHTSEVSNLATKRSQTAPSIASAATDVVVSPTSSSACSASSDSSDRPLIAVLPSASPYELAQPGPIPASDPYAAAAMWQYYGLYAGMMAGMALMQSVQPLSTAPTASQAFGPPTEQEDWGGSEPGDKHA